MIADVMMKIAVWLVKKSELLSALSVRLVYLTGKSKVLIHPKHLIHRTQEIWFKSYLDNRDLLLDAGCGSGQHALRAAKFVRKVVAVDKDPNLLNIGIEDAKQREIKNIQFAVADLERTLPYGENCFDKIMILDVLEHIQHRGRFLTEISRILRKGGKVFIVVPNKDTSWKKTLRRYGLFSYSDPDHKIEYSSETIIKELTQGCLKIVEVKPHSYDTPWVGVIDLIGGLSLSLYKKLAVWKAEMVKMHPENCSGFLIVAQK